MLVLGPELVPSITVFLRTAPSVLANRYSANGSLDTANGSFTVKPVDKSKLGVSAIQITKI